MNARTQLEQVTGEPAPTKEAIVTLLRAWIHQRPGLDAANYFGSGDYAENLRNYRAEVRSIGRDLADARQLLRAVELSTSLTAECLIDSFRAFSGRLQLCYGRGWYLDYCTGQYWPTEYRRAACAVLASALWAHVREHCMPPATFRVEGKTFPTMETAQAHANTFLPAIVAIEERHNGRTPGDWLRYHFRREYGARIQRSWFD